MMCGLSSAAREQLNRCGYLPDESELELGGMLLPLEELPEELPGDSAPPVAEPAPESPK